MTSLLRLGDLDGQRLLGMIKVGCLVEFSNVLRQDAILLTLILVDKVLSLHHHPIVEGLVLRGSFLLLLGRVMSLLIALHQISSQPRQRTGLS